MKGFYCLMQNKYIAKRRKGKHLTLAGRSKIEVYLKEKKTKAYIAEKIGVSERTIYFKTAGYNYSDVQKEVKQFLKFYPIYS